MFDESTKYRVLQPFFRRPLKTFRLRELARETDISTPTVRQYVRAMVESGLLERVDEGTYPGYRADRGERFTRLKRLETIRLLYDTGLIDALAEEFHPSAIVLFGSAARGEDTEKSDIDILVVADQHRFDVGSYEERFDREINLQFVTEQDLKQNKEFANSVANGTVMHGFLRVV